MSWKSWAYRILATFASTFTLFAVVLFIVKDDPPIPSLSLLSLTGTAAAFEIADGSSNCVVRNLTAVFSVSGRNKVPVIYTDFHLFGRQRMGIVHGSMTDFIAASMASPSVQSLERFGEWSDTIAFSVPEESVYFGTWTTVEKDNQTIRTAISRLQIYPSFVASYAAGKRRSTFMFFVCAVSTQSPNGLPLLAEVVVYSGNRSPELNFSKNVFGCSCSSPPSVSDLFDICLLGSILLGMVTEISWRARARRLALAAETKG